MTTYARTDNTGEGEMPKVANSPTGALGPNAVITNNTKTPPPVVNSPTAASGPNVIGMRFGAGLIKTSYGYPI